MSEPYAHGEDMDEGGYYGSKSSFSPAREDLVSSNSGSSILRPRVKKQSAQWVFISRKADIGIVLVLLLALGAGIMWFIARLPSYLETASAHYHWAMEMYATWGTPSMRWLFINLVVGIIVTTSGLLSAFGAGGGGGAGAGGANASGRSGGSDRSLSAGGGGSSGGSKGRFYEGPHAPSYNHAAALLYQRNTNPPSSPYDAISYNAGSTRFTGPGYESPVYNPYVKAVEDGLPSQNSLGAWVYELQPQEENSHHAHGGSGSGEMETREQEEGAIPRSLEAPDDEERDVNFAFVGHHPPGDVMTREVALSPQDSAKSSWEMHPPRGMVLSRGMSIPEDENSPEDNDDMPVAEYDDAPEPEVEEYPVEKVYDPVPAVAEGNADYVHESGTEHHHHHHHRTKTEPSIHFDSADDDAVVGNGGENISSPPKPEILPKSHTFTIGRVIRRDQLVDFIEPLSRRLEGIGRKVRLDPHRSSNCHGGGGEASNQSREVVGGPSTLTAKDISPALLAAAAEAGQGPGPVSKPHVAADSASHRRRHSAEAMPVFSHRRRLSSESVPHPYGAENAPPPGNSRFPDPLQAAAARSTAFLAAAKPSAAPAPLLKQRSIVYPPALLSETSGPNEDASPPSSPPMEEAILPPPPPPHLKLSSSRDTANFATKLSRESTTARSLLEKKTASKDSEKKQLLPPKHSRSASSLSGSGLGPEFSAAAQDAATGKSRGGKSGAVSSSEIHEFRETFLAKERQQDSPGSSMKDDDLHQKIEDFLARFHENSRL